MEVSGVEGSYRSTCERTMSVLRENRDSLVAMLEAFVYDPLISFRLLGNNSKNAARGSDSISMFEPKKYTKNETIDQYMTQDFCRGDGMVPDASFVEVTDDEYPMQSGEESTWSQNTGSTGISMKKDKKLSSKPKPLEMYMSIQAMAAKSTSNHIASSVLETKLDRSYKQRETMSADIGANLETMNEKAIKVIRRVQEKLVSLF
jgi:phosphatidylinositol kinase/protein kinase (PI-3  family)